MVKVTTLFASSALFSTYFSEPISLFLLQILLLFLIIFFLDASFLVNIGSINPNTVPGKIFEYFAYNKPILSTYSIVDEPSINYLKKLFFIR